MAKNKNTDSKVQAQLVQQDQPEASPEATPQSDNKSAVHAEPLFPIVGIGASAGGLAAFEAFFKAMPVGFQPSMAYVLVQHLARDHKSILTEIIKAYSTMPVFEIIDGLTVNPNTIYIIPPNKDLALFDGKLHLLDQVSERGVRLPIDFFFRSLAQDQGERAIGIVLSGTGSDGTLGVRAIKGEGGLVIAQTPESTEYDGMPRSAIATNMVDFVLPPAEIPAKLAAYASRAFGPGSASLTSAPKKVEDTLQKIFILLRAESGHDFSQYKRNTISRRIDRRMAVQHVDNINEYLRFLQQTPAEVGKLFHDLLIGVTNFFRDPEAFAMLETEAIPRLFEGKPAGATIRIWVPGCSTGEEAYSIAILLQEQMEAMKQSFKVQLFATDIDNLAIAQARSGIFPASIAADVSPERLAHFFSQSPDGMVYQIQKNIRDMLIFSEQNLIQDPPFSRLDMISCRNLLIYINAGLQKSLIPLFHYALVPGGLLFLGNSETVGEYVSLFGTLDRKWKLYWRKEDVPGTAVPGMGRFIPSGIAASALPSEPQKLAAAPRLPLRTLTEQALLEAYAPGSVLVNAMGDILYIYGRTGQYLEPTPGEADMNILTMAREGLRQRLTMALHKAVKQQETIVYPALQVKNNASFIHVDLAVRPLAISLDKVETSTPLLYLVTFAPTAEPAPNADTTLSAAPAENTELTPELTSRITELEQALQTKEEYLQSTREEMDTANEELKSTNEELQSVNEELQSTNEELETSKEELQSVNEELSTVNAELQQKVQDLSRTNNDMNNLLAGTGIGTIFVDHQLHILRFTPTVTQLINLIQTDIGRPVHHIVTNLVGYDRLAADIQDVLDTLNSKEVEVQTAGGDWYLFNIRPYRTLENVIEGAVLTFTNISRTKQAESLERLAAVVRDANDAITVHDLHGNILAWNPAAEKIYGWHEMEALTLTMQDRVPAAGQQDALNEMERLLHLGQAQSYQTKRLTKDGRTLNIWLTASILLNEVGTAYAIATTERVVDP